LLSKVILPNARTSGFQQSSYLLTRCRVTRTSSGASPAPKWEFKPAGPQIALVRKDMILVGLVEDNRICGEPLHIRYPNPLVIEVEAYEVLA
jgi:hypothetical protein